MSLSDADVSKPRMLKAFLVWEFPVWLFRCLLCGGDGGCRGGGGEGGGAEEDEWFGPEGGSGISTPGLFSLSIL